MTMAVYVNFISHIKGHAVGLVMEQAKQQLGNLDGLPEVKQEEFRH